MAGQPCAAGFGPDDGGDCPVPEEYRGRIYMGNVHGRRVNVDRLERNGSGYVRRHEPDFLTSANPWFRTVQLLYGPDGDVFLSDWTDLGECHDNGGVHRTSGRIYKIVHGEASPPLGRDLFEASDEDLLDLQLADNEWFARTARRLQLPHGRDRPGRWARLGERLEEPGRALAPHAGTEARAQPQAQDRRTGIA